jgi:hypothetical protein
MKKLLFLMVGISCCLSLSAQQAVHNANGSYSKPCFYVKATKPLKELIAERDAKRKSGIIGYPHPAADAGSHEAFNKRMHKSEPNYDKPDGALQSTDGPDKSATTVLNFDGQASLQGGYPMDPNGMIGSNYYVQAANSSFAAWTKTGSVYIPQTDLYNLFGNIGDGDCGDPVVIYDKAADRWIITEFEGCENFSNGGDVDTLLMAVSQTNDPAGAYWLYAFDPNVNAYDDYPKYHVWSDGYYMTCNCQGPDMVVVYQRDSMLLGKNANMIVMNWGYGPGLSGCTGDFFCPMLLDADGTLPPYGSPEYLFYYWDDGWGCGGTQDSICIEQIKIDWKTLSGTIDGNYQHLNTAAFNSNFNGGFDQNIPQPGNNTSNYLASSDGFFAYRIPYYRWSSYNSAVMCYPVNVGTLSAPVSGMRWYELRQDTTTKLWSIYQQSTYAPSDGISRWMGNIAMDMNGNIGMAYSVSDPTSVYPGIRYTGRKACDPLNTMTLSEVTVVSGNTLIKTPQSSGNRWGDYSLLSLDPVDGKTFWYTNMYAKNGASFSTNMQTRIVSFQLPVCATGVNNVVEHNEALNAYQSGSMLNVKGSNMQVGERVVVELFDINGKRLMQSAMVPSSNTLETSFNVSSLAKAIYIVRIGNDEFQRAVKLVIN